MMAAARFLDGEEPDWNKRPDPRRLFADWATARDNPYFARMAVNRIWAQLFGVGLVDPIDDFGPHNKPSHPELLDELARAFADNGCDEKFLSAPSRARRPTSGPVTPTIPARRTLASSHA
jgi:hypothetical protein